MAVDDAGSGSVQGGDAGEVRLQRPRLGPVEEPEARHAVGLAPRRDGLDGRSLGRVGGDDELAAGPMRHAVALAEGVEHRGTRHAVPGAERPGGIVHPAVDHLRVPRRDAGADRPFAFRHHDRVTAPRQRTGDSETNDSGTDDEDVHHGLKMSTR